MGVTTTKLKDLYNDTLSLPRLIAGEGRKCAVVLSSLPPHGYRIQLVYAEHPYGGSICHSTARYSTKDAGQIKALTPAYLELAEAINALCEHGATLDDGTGNVRGMLVQVRGTSITSTPDSLYTAAGVRHCLTRRTKRVKTHLAAFVDGVDPLRTNYEALASDLTDLSVEFARRQRLQRLLDERPELSVEETLALVEAEFPLALPA